MWNQQEQEDDESWEVRAFAQDTSNIMGTTWPPRSYSCTFCRREFRSAQALGGHMNIHRRDRARLHQASPNNNPISPHSHTHHPSSSFLNISHHPFANPRFCLLYPFPSPNTVPFSPFTHNTAIPHSLSSSHSHPPSSSPASFHSHPDPGSNVYSSSEKVEQQTTTSSTLHDHGHAHEELDLELRLGNRSRST